MSLPASVVRAQSNAVSSKTALRILPSVATVSAAPLICSTTPATIQGSHPVPVNISSHQNLPPIWFNSSFPRFDLPSSNNNPRGPEDERKIKLGKSEHRAPIGHLRMCTIG